MRNLTKISQVGEDIYVGLATTDKVGAYGTTPAIQPTSGDQAAVTTAAITPVPTTAVTQVVTTTATSTSPYGFTEAQANAIIASLNACLTRQALIETAANDTITRQALIITLVNAIRSALVTLGWIKGS